MTSPVDIPHDWEAFSLGDLLDLSNGINAAKSAYGSGVPFVNVLEVITHETLNERLIPGRIKASTGLLARYRVSYGDVLFNPDRA